MVKEPAIETIDLYRSFEDVVAVDGVSFKVPSGTLYSLLGPNGAGKTTTLNMLSCNLEIEDGSAQIMGNSVKRNPKEVRKYIGICPQENVLYDHLTITENLIFFGKMYDVPKDRLNKRAKELIKKLGLEKKANNKTSDLSGGQKKRVNLIAGLIHDPDVLFLDEPTAGLDPQTRRLVWEYIEDLKEREKTVILTTHYMDEADILSDIVGIMDHGKIIAEDSPENLKESIGKGDSLLFTLTGTNHQIEKVFDDLISHEEIMSWAPLETQENQYRITALDGIGKIGKIVNKFIENKVQVEDIGIRANSLENVFLELTGRSLRE